MGPLAPPKLNMSHVGIFCTNPAKLADFYCRFLGFTVTDKGKLPTGDLIFLSLDPTEHHQIVLASGRAEGAPTTVNQISLRTDSLATLREMHKRLLTIDDDTVSDIQPVHHGNAVSLYFRDAEGNRLELFIDAPFYCQQPQRVPIDLTKSDDEIWKTVEEHASKQPNFMSRDEWEAGLRKKMEARL